MSESNAEIWFKTGSYDQLIKPVRVVKATEKTVEVERSWGGKTTTIRSHKRSSYENYFPTWDEAHAFLLEKAERRLASARSELMRAQGHHGNIKGMTKPEENSNA